MRISMMTGVALAALALTSAAQAQSTAGPSPIAGRSPFGAAVVFGDSLSDDGNISLAAGATTPMRFTTNPATVTVENVASAYGLPLAPSFIGGNDYAWGGAGVTTNAPGTPAGVPTETAQITGYLAAHPQLDSRTLYTVFGGANDIFAAATALYTGQTTAAAATAKIAAAGTLEGNLVGQLNAAGARTIVVFNLPDIGLTPQALGLNALIPGSAAQLTALSQAYNDALNLQIKAHPHGVVPVNTFALLREVVANPAAVGFVNVTTAACTTASSLTCTPATLKTPDAARTYLFADAVHPTAAAHAIFGQAVVSELAAPAYISLLAESPLQTTAAQRGAWSQELSLDQTDPEARTRVFGRVDYASRTFDAAGYDGRAGGDGAIATLGFDWRPSADLSAGVVFSAGRSNASYDDGAAKFRDETYLVSVFAQRRLFGGGYVNGAAGLGDLQFDDISRSFSLGPARRGERGDTDGSVGTVALGGGWWFGGEQVAGGTLRFGPYVEGRYERVHVQAYAEDGSDSTAMTFGEQTREALVGELGLKARGLWRTGFGVLAPYGAIAYAYDGRAETRYVDAGLVTLPGEFSLPGYAPAKSWGTLEAGIEARFARGWTAFAGYQGRFGDVSQSLDTANVGVRLAF